VSGFQDQDHSLDENHAFLWSRLEMMMKESLELDGTMVAGSYSPR
jgi:hypothetical protein